MAKSESQVSLPVGPQHAYALVRDPFAHAELSAPLVRKLSQDDRAELERRLGEPFELDGSFGSLWAIELLLRTVRRVPAFHPLVGWIVPYLRALLTRGYRQAGFPLLDSDEDLVSVQSPAFVSNVADAVSRMVEQRPPESATDLSPVFRMAMAPRFGLEAISLGHPTLALDRVRRSAELHRLVDWLVGEQLRAATGEDRQLAEAGYEVVRSLVAPAYGYAKADGAEQVRAIGELLGERRKERAQVLRSLCAVQDLYAATLAGRACLELGVEPQSSLQARGIHRAIRHFGEPSHCQPQVLEAVAALRPRVESPIEGTDHPRYAEADRAIGSGDFARAHQLFTELVEERPNHAAYRCYRGFAAERLGRPPEESTDDYDQAISLQPDYWQALINRGVLLSRNRQFHDADRDLVLAQALRPECAHTRNNLLLNYYFRRLEELDEAAESVRGAVPIAPPLPEPPAEAFLLKPPARPVAAAPLRERDFARSDEVPSQRKRIVDDREDWHVYEVLEPLGEGGMGKVYRVRHLGWGIDLALKIPRLELLERGGVEGFVEEAEAWSRLGIYPHTVDCYYVRMRRGVPWLFAELVAGGSLADWIKQGKLRSPSGADPETCSRVLGTMLDMALQMTYGLQHAHDHGLIHQDMKPANVILSKEGIAKVTDFGLAKVTRLAEPPEGSGRRNKTLMADFAGMTPVYCSPEQAAASRSPDRVDLTRRTDLWSWAVTVLEMFTGEARWMSGVLAPEAMYQYLEDGGWDERIPLMPDRLVKLLERCFARKEADRPADMLEVAGELSAIYCEATGASHARDRPVFHDDIAGVLTNRGASMFDLGRRRAAQEAWEHALAADPHHPEATYNLALLEWRRGLITDLAAVERMQAAQASYDTDVLTSHESDLRMAALEGWLHHERADLAAAQDCSVRALSRSSQTSQMMKRVSAPLAHCKKGFDPQSVLSLPSAAHLLASSRDERIVATAHDDGVRVWQLPTAQPLRRTNGRAKLLTLSDDGSVAAMATDDTLYVWHPAVDDPLQTPLANPSAISFCAHAYVVAAAGEALVRVDARSGEQLELGRHGAAINSVDTMADGRLIATASDDATVQLRLPDGQLTRTLRHERPVEWVSITADGKRAVSGSWNAERSHYRLSIWDTVQGSLILRLEEPAPRRAALTDDGRFALGWDELGTLKLWQLDNGRCLRTARPIDDVSQLVCIAGDRVMMASGGELHQVDVLHEAPRAPIMVARPRDSDVLGKQHARFVAAIDRTERALASRDLPTALASLEDAVAVPGHRRHPVALELETRIAHSTARGPFRSSVVGKPLRDLGGPVHAVGLSPDGSSVLSVVCHAGTHHVEVSCHETATGQCTASLHASEDAGPFEAAAIAASAGIVATACGGTVRVWRMDAGVASSIPGAHHPRDLALSRDGRSLLVCRESDLALWDIEAERWLDPVAVKGASAAALASDVDALAVAAAGTLTLWALAARQPLRELSREAGVPEQLVLTPDAALVAVRLDDGSIVASDVAAGRPCGAVSAERPSAIAIADEGGVLAVGQRDGQVGLCDLAAGAATARLGAHYDEVLSLAFTRDGRLLASGGRDGDVRLWHLEFERELSVALGVTMADPQRAL